MWCFNGFSHTRGCPLVVIYGYCPGENPTGRYSHRRRSPCTSRYSTLLYSQSCCPHVVAQAAASPLLLSRRSELRHATALLWARLPHHHLGAVLGHEGSVCVAAHERQGRRILHINTPLRPRTMSAAPVGSSVGGAGVPRVVRDGPAYPARSAIREEARRRLYRAAGGSSTIQRRGDGLHAGQAHMPNLERAHRGVEPGRGWGGVVECVGHEKNGTLTRNTASTRTGVAKGGREVYVPCFALVPAPYLDILLKHPLFLPHFLHNPPLGLDYPLDCYNVASAPCLLVRTHTI